MTATNNTPAATTEIVIGSQALELAKGDEIAVTTTSDNMPLVGQFVSLTPRGLRMRVSGKYVTRKMSVVTDIEVRGGDDAAPAAGEVTTFAEAAPAQADAPAPAPAAVELDDATVDSEFAALVEATAAEQAAAAPAAEATEDAPEPEYDTNPIIDGTPLREMRFAAVMKLAQKYKTPGRGVARIDALRDGVAKAISEQAGRLAAAE